MQKDETGRPVAGHHPRSREFRDNEDAQQYISALRSMPTLVITYQVRNGWHQVLVEEHDDDDKMSLREVFDEWRSFTLPQDPVPIIDNTGSFFYTNFLSWEA